MPRVTTLSLYCIPLEGGERVRYRPAPQFVQVFNSIYNRWDFVVVGYIIHAARKLSRTA